MHRLNLAGRIIRESGAQSVLDVGCRKGELREHVNGVEYAGCDLFPAPHVRYAGDVTTVDVPERFDCVTALDILEHTDAPHAVFDKLIGIARHLFVVTLPNCYSLSVKWKFLVHDRMGGKYNFGPTPTTDRHRWVMSVPEIHAFYQHKAAQHGCALEVIDLAYGDGQHAIRNAILRIALPRSWMMHTVMGVFRKGPPPG
jgi:hypothetical protein